jgi:glucan phosphoethanolaminetransferase (alkaline phosphatase superfamily)
MRPAGRQGRLAARRRARWLGALAVAGPWLAVAIGDLARRPRLIASYDRLHALGYAASLAGSLVIWSVLAAASSRRRGAVSIAVGALFVGAFTLIVGVQGAFRGIYGAYLSMDAVLTTDSFASAMVGSLPFDRPAVWAHFAIALALAASLLAAARRHARLGRRARIASIALVPAVLYGAVHVPVSWRGVQSTTPDLLYAHGLATLAREITGIDTISAYTRPQRHEGEPVRPISTRPARPRNVLFVLQESVRADVTCTAFDPRCDKPARAVNPLLPDRLPLLEMRSNAGVTAVSVQVLWSGLAPTASREDIRRAPLVWDYARAAGFDTAYFTTQDLTSYNSRLFVQDAAIAHFTSGTNLDEAPPEHTGPRDELAADHALAHLGELREPFFAVVQLCNAHGPYLVDERDTPYRPQRASYEEDGAFEMHNRYRDAVYQSDQAVAKLVKGLRATGAGERTVIVFTSDHGEMFFDDPGGYYGHSWTVRDEEVHVPAWIDAPPGTLTDAERASLASAREDRVFHLDLAATLIDLVGAWDAPEIAAWRARMPGHPLTRPERTRGPVPMTSQTWIWDAWEANFGMMDGSKKVFAQKRDGAFHCFDLATDPTEEHDLGEAGCPELVAATRRTFGGLPSEVPTGRWR